MSHLIMYTEYRHLDKKSRALVSRCGAKCDDEACKVLLEIISCSEAMEHYELNDQFAVFDKVHKELYRKYRKLNRLFRKLYRRCHSKM